MLPNNIFLLGGGASIRYLGAIDNGLFTFLKDKFTIGINYSYKFFEATVQLGNDQSLYDGLNEYKGSHEEIAKLPLWIGKQYKCLKFLEPNSIFFKHSKIYNRDLKGGIYKGGLSGITALSLAIKLMSLGQKYPMIYILGYDGGALLENGRTLKDSKELPLTHWYQEEFNHRGCGCLSLYKQHRFNLDAHTKCDASDYDYRPFTTINDVKIYNVGGLSKIPHFEHISYEEMFTKTYISVQNQNSLRHELREVLEWIKEENQI
jgi:hypothetical protein